MNPKDHPFNKKLNLFSLSIFGIGTIIGAGIYSVTGIAYVHAQETLWISFIMASVAAICTAYSYCELAAMYPSAGAEFIYVRKALPDIPILSFIIATIILFAGAAVSAAVAFSFAGYLQSFFKVSVYILAIVLMFICTLVNNFGVEQSNRVNIFFTFIELAGILFIIWTGLSMESPVSVPVIAIHKGTRIATSLIFFVYLGFEEIVNLSEEAKNPYRDVPRAIFLSLMITTILYLAVSFAVIRLIKPEALAGSLSPLSDAIFQRAPLMSRIMILIALFSTANTVLVTLLVLSRMVFSMAREGDLPKLLAKIHDSYSIPHYASFFVFFISSSFLYLKNLEQLVSFSSFATLLAFLSVNVSIIVLRYTKPYEIRPYRIPINVGAFPVISGIGIIIGVVMCLQFEKVIYLVTFFIILLCLIYYKLQNYFNSVKRLIP